MKLKLILLIYGWLVLGAVGVCAAEQAIYYHTKYMRAAILLRHYDHRVQTLENKEKIYLKKLATLEAKQEEIKAWRISITLASRMGWPAATRYIREYPLEEMTEAGF